MKLLIALCKSFWTYRLDISMMYSVGILPKFAAWFWRQSDISLVKRLIRNYCWNVYSFDHWQDKNDGDLPARLFNGISDVDKTLVIYDVPPTYCTLCTLCHCVTVRPTSALVNVNSSYFRHEWAKSCIWAFCIWNEFWFLCEFIIKWMIQFGQSVNSSLWRSAKSRNFRNSWSDIGWTIFNFCNGR